MSVPSVVPSPASVHLSEFEDPILCCASILHYRPHKGEICSFFDGTCTDVKVPSQKPIVPLALSQILLMCWSHFKDIVLILAQVYR